MFFLGKAEHSCSIFSAPGRHSCGPTMVNLITTTASAFIKLSSRRVRQRSCSPCRPCFCPNSINAAEANPPQHTSGFVLAHPEDRTPLCVTHALEPFKPNEFLIRMSHGLQPLELFSHPVYLRPLQRTVSRFGLLVHNLHNPTCAGGRLCTESR